MRELPMKTTAGFVLAFLAILTMVFATARLAVDRARASEQVRHTLDVLHQIQSVRSTLQDAETGQRGYLLSMDEAYLRPFEAAGPRLGEELATLRSLVMDNPAQSARVEQLETAARGKLAELEETVAAARAGRIGEAMAVVKAGRGKKLMDDARRILTELEDAETRLLIEREALSRAAFSRLLYGVYGGGALLLLLTVGAALLTRRDFVELRAHQAQQERLAEYQQRLIGMTSHDLRSPLTAVLVSSGHLVRSGELSESARNTARRILRASSRAVAVASTMQDYTHARLGSGVPIEPRPSRLPDVVERVTDELRAGHPDARIEVTTAGDLSGIFDPDRLAQAVSNLVTNAFRYGDTSRPVRVTARALPGDRLEVEVHNEGGPIPEKEQSTIFEPFQRGSHGQAQGKERGLGLGLYIVQEIARAHGGTVRVESREGEGTRFTLQIPRQVTAPRPGAAGAEAVSERLDDSSSTPAPLRLVPAHAG